MRKLFLPALAALVVFSGCATRKEIIGFQEDTQYLRQRADSASADQQIMREQIDQLVADFRDMRANSEYGSSEMQERVSTLAARLDEILTRLDRSLAPLEEFLRGQVGTQGTGPAPAMGVDVYDAAMQDLSLGNYDLAEVGFLSFLQQNPKSELADDARYGLAESFYARKKYEEAAAEYSRVIDMDPMGWKAPAAMLKLGLSYRQLGRTREARTVWQQLMRDFPNSEEAKVAEQRMDEVGW
ncbi:MAG: tol-pal system protein YbgF [Calditrichaeota bacterium]|nr:tol-pal system protein YbgF [Calditrichota bacterium]MCB9391413.1 tol-pal system protein YbgF [Calditrichota bacterium]